MRGGQLVREERVLAEVKVIDSNSYPEQFIGQFREFHVKWFQGHILFLLIAVSD